MFVARVVISSILAGTSTVTSQPHDATAACQLDAPLVQVPELTEGSGIAHSHLVSGRFYAHNDSGEPVLFTLDDRGKVVGRVTLSGAAVEDWEAIAVGRCPSGSCIFVADIGDNDAERRTIAIYRIPEPQEPMATVSVTEVFEARYPDGAHDAETLLMTPPGDMLIVTKGDTGPVAIYRFPRDARAGEIATLEQVGEPRGGNRPPSDERITDGAVSPSGTWVALRTTRAVTLHRLDELLAGNWREVRRVPLETLGEPQGEGIGFADESTLFLVGEGGGKARPGTFGRVTCTL